MMLATMNCKEQPADRGSFFGTELCVLGNRVGFWLRTILHSFAHPPSHTVQPEQSALKESSIARSVELELEWDGIARGGVGG
jgi:hypothetical protein